MIAGLSIRLLAALLLAPLALLMQGCGGGDGVSADPALYRIDTADAPGGAAPAGWLFGTIHALPPDTRWRNPGIEAALDDAGVLVVEIADLDRTKAQAVFAQLAVDRGMPPLADRVRPEYRDELAELLAKAGTSEARFRHLETWAAAMSLAAMAQGQSGLDADAGVDRALIADFRERPGKRLRGLETVEGQLRIFDRLDEDAQRALLQSLLEQTDRQGKDMAQAWLAGDADALVGMMDMGLGDASLRGALLTRRNARWVGPISAELDAGSRPFVAVGAGHIGGDDGLIALLRARGWRVTRVK